MSKLQSRPLLLRLTCMKLFFELHDLEFHGQAVATFVSQDLAQPVFLAIWLAFGSFRDVPREESFGVEG